MTQNRIRTALAKRLRATAMSAAAVTMISGAATTASAQITFAGITGYAFNGGSFTPTATLGGLTVTQGGFSTTTNAFGFASIGGVGNNLGLVSLVSSILFNYTGNTFQMRVAFTNPTAGSQTFFANVIGSVINFQGGAKIHFNPSTITGIPFTNGPGSGTFDFDVNDVSVTPGFTNAEITGDIQAYVNPPVTTSTPEPASMTLLATGLAGMAGFVRRRTKKETVA